MAKSACPKNEANAERAIKLKIFCRPSVIIGKREITPGILGGENSIIANLDDIKFLKVKSHVGN